MKNFDYVSARTVDEAVEALASSKGPARPIAGGTDLIVQLTEGRRTLDRVVDLGNIPELRTVQVGDDGSLNLGAAAPCATVYSNLPVRKGFPILIDGASIVGSIQIQSRASVGGNLCNAAPSADTIPALICLDAEAVVQGPDGQRTVPVDEFCTGPGQTVLKPGELLVALRMRAPAKYEGGKYQRFIPRNEMDIAVAGAGSLVRVDPESNEVTHARIALASVAPTPLRVKAAEEALVGQEVSAAAIDEAADLAVSAAKPISDVRGSADYRRHLVGVLVRRTLVSALEQAGAKVDYPKGGVAIGG